MTPQFTGCRLIRGEMLVFFPPKLHSSSSWTLDTAPPCTTCRGHAAYVPPQAAKYASLGCVPRRSGAPYGAHHSLPRGGKPVATFCP
jgi:hypothetical protein